MLAEYTVTSTTVSEYAEYIKFIILGLIVLAVIYFIIKKKLNKKQEKVV